ncbi:MAG: metallopeptidase family protein [Mariprofundaceae bacterium]
MDAEEFRKTAQEALDELPVLFRLAMENVVIVTDDFPTIGTLREMKAESPYDLLGLFQGWPLPDRGVQYGGHPPDIIHLYRKPILAYSEAHGEEITHCIRHVLIHEIGHYFGFSDEEMEEVECQP